MLPYLQRPEKDVRVAAIGAVAQLAGEQHAEVVKPYIQQAATGAEETVVRAANKAMQKLEGLTSRRAVRRRLSSPLTRRCPLRVRQWLRRAPQPLRRAQPAARR